MSTPLFSYPWPESYGFGFVEADGVAGFATVTGTVDISGEDGDYSFTITGTATATRVPWVVGELYTGVPNTFALGYARRQGARRQVFVQTADWTGALATAEGIVTDIYDGESETHPVDLRLDMSIGWGYGAAGASLALLGASLAPDPYLRVDVLHPRSLGGLAALLSGTLGPIVVPASGGDIERTETYTFSVA